MVLTFYKIRDIFTTVHCA